MELVLFIFGLAAGAGAFYWRSKVADKKKRRIPKEWPLKVRALVSSSERRVWIWLSKVMFDQQILVKVPVTRFTAPAQTDNAAHWYQLLNGVYCTFTLCSMDGKVIGCVDVAGRKGLSMSNQTLKHGLLAHCGLPYWVVDPDNLPHLNQIRTAFLGELAVSPQQPAPLASQIKNVAVNLQAVVSRQREGKSSNFARLEAEFANETVMDASQLPEGWEQNSFVTPLDSRSASL